MDEDSACCSPSAGRGDGAHLPSLAHGRGAGGEGADPAALGMLLLPGGEFLMGTDDARGYPADGEGPVHRVSLRSFWIDPLAVTNARFCEFVDATGHVTEAERFGWSFVFAGLLPDDFPETRGVVNAPWWRQVEGAGWRHPEGPQSDLAGRADHPVVHVTWRDAAAYCAWASLRLPSEAEWEYAARGGLEQKRYPWGDELTPGGVHRCNVWQGEFPRRNACDDGYYSTAPVDAFEANGLGLYNMAGNAWEWCGDWFSPGYYRDSPPRDPAEGPNSRGSGIHPDPAEGPNSRGSGIHPDPTGPAEGTHRVIRGGSYLCHESYCFRYRVAARSASTPDSSTGNTGFRTARDASRLG